MRLLDFERSVVLTWVLVILIGAVVALLIGILAFTLAMMQTGWFVIVWLAFCGVVALVPVVARLFGRRRHVLGPALGRVDVPPAANDNPWRPLSRLRAAATGWRRGDV